MLYLLKFLFQYITALFTFVQAVLKTCSGFWFILYLSSKLLILVYINKNFSIFCKTIVVHEIWCITYKETYTYNHIFHWSIFGVVVSFLQKLTYLQVLNQKLIIIKYSVICTLAEITKCFLRFFGRIYNRKYLFSNRLGRN